MWRAADHPHEDARSGNVSKRIGLHRGSGRCFWNDDRRSSRARWDGGGAEPPNCSVADVAGVTAGVSASMSAYLFAHPDTNAFLSSLEGMPRADAMTAERQYYDRNPGVEQDLAGIRQPLTDLRARCGEGRGVVDGADVNVVAVYLRPPFAPRAV